MNGKERLRLAIAKREMAAKAMEKEATADTIKAYEDALKEVTAAQDQVKKEEIQETQNHPQGRPTDEGNGQHANLTESQKFMNKLREAVTAGTTFSGLVPTDISKSIIEKRNKLAKLRQYCTVIPAAGDYRIAVEGNGVTVYQVAEGGDITDSNPTVTPITLTAYKFDALVKISKEALSDPAVDVMGFLTDMIAKGFAEKEDDMILNGSGLDSVTGAVTKIKANSGRVLNCASATVLTWKEVKALISKINDYRDNAILVMNQDTADNIQDFTDGAGHYLFDQTVPLSNIRGVRVVISSKMPDEAAGIPFIIAGDFSYYNIADRQGFTLEYLNELFAKSGQKGIIGECRYDGNVTNEDAFAVLEGKASA